MRSPNKRSRSKSNRPRTLGNIVNRVFDSSGPEGKVRGTPQQIIEKYQVLARDAQVSNDRVAAENFQQHAEHYTRMLAQAQREMQAEQDARRQQHDDRQRQQGQQGQQAHDERGQNRTHNGNTRRAEPRADQSERTEAYGATESTGAGIGAPRGSGFETVDAGADRTEQGDEANLVMTPESYGGEQPDMAQGSAPLQAPAASADAATDGPARAPRRQARARAKPAEGEPASAEAPKPRRAPRKPRAKSADGGLPGSQTPSAAAE
ncbi:MAG: DUF4167 domain-containing protein [Roseinatronobacter sp.]